MDEFEAYANIVERIARIPYELAFRIAEIVLGRSRRRLLQKRPPPLGRIYRM